MKLKTGVTEVYKMTVGSEAVLLWYRQLAGATSATHEAELSESGKPPRPLAAAITRYQPRNQIDSSSSQTSRHQYLTVRSYESTSTILPCYMNFNRASTT
jgi:hypothetical protein